MAGNGGEYVSFGKSKFNAKRVSEFSKFFKEEGEINVRESDRGVVNNGSSMRLGAEKVIVRLLVVKETELRAFKEKGIDLFE